MPWHVGTSDSCPASKPHAVIKDSDGKVVGCHATAGKAKQQLAALYASEESKSMQLKSFDVIETKADEQSGTFEALVSVFGNVDRVGDRIMPGAYTKTLRKWQESGDPIPIILSHQWDNPMSHIGVANPMDVKQTPRGLLVKAKLDVHDNDVAKQVHRLMARRSLKEFSIGYKVPAGGENVGDDGANEISEIDLVECGPCMKGVNSETQLLAVKSAVEAEQGVEPPRGEDELRKETDQLRRARTEAVIPKGLPEPEPAPEPVSPEIEALRAEVEQLKAAQAAPEPRNEDELRKATDRIRKDQTDAEIPPGLPAPPEPASELEQMDAIKAELAEIRDTLQDVLEGMKTQKPDGAYVSDPLKEASRREVLEIQSDGASLAKPPPQKQEPAPMPIDESDLRRRSREEIMSVLRGSRNDKE